jgi:ABC-type multidrug transport system permease subunit
LLIDWVVGVDWIIVPVTVLVAVLVAIEALDVGVALDEVAIVALVVLIGHFSKVFDVECLTLL